MLRRRTLLRALSTWFPCGVVHSRALSSQLELTSSTNLYEIAAAHVRIAEESRSDYLWGRIGGSPAERKSARLLADQLRPVLAAVQLERYEFAAHRPSSWKLRLADGSSLQSCMPAPFDARFPPVVEAPLIHLQPDSDWAAGKEQWIFVESERGAFGGSNTVRRHSLFQRAVISKAAWLVFSLPLPRPDRTWKTVITVEKPYAVKDQLYPNMRRPIPCFWRGCEGCCTPAGCRTERFIADGINRL